jgi:hypothetical protein
MNSTHTCKRCRYHYEISFDEDYDAPIEDDDEDILEPEYCPFCGAHIDDE